MKKGVVLLIIALFCCGFIPQQVATRQLSQRATEIFTEAIKSLSIYGDSVTARAHLHRVLEIDSTHTPALAMLSKLTRNDSLRACYAEKAYRSDSSNLYYTQLYQEALIDALRFEEAAKLSYRIIEHSTNPRDFFVLARLLEATNRQDEAIAVLDSSCVRVGRVLPLCLLRQQLLIQQGRIPEAEADAKRGIELEPYAVENYTSLAEIYANTKRDSLAVQTFIKALEVDSNNLELLSSFSRFLLEHDCIEESLIILEKMFAHEDTPIDEKLRMWKTLQNWTDFYRQFYHQYDRLIKTIFTHHPDNKEVVEQYILHLIKSGEVEQALKHLKISIKKHPAADPDIMLSIIGLESHLNRPDSVKMYAEEAHRLFPNNIEVLQAVAFVDIKNKKYQEACDHLHGALKLADSDTLRSELWGSIGDVEHNLNNMKRCYKAYNKALRYNADNSSVLNNYAYFLSQEGRDLEFALTMATRAISLSESNPIFLDTMAWVLYKLGRYEEAKRYMQQALSLDRDNMAELAIHYGDILFALGDKFMAELYWRKALERGYDAKEIEARFQKSKQQ